MIGTMNYCYYDIETKQVYKDKEEAKKILGGTNRFYQCFKHKRLFYITEDVFNQIKKSFE